MLIRCLCSGCICWYLVVFIWLWIDEFMLTCFKQFSRSRSNGNHTKNELKETTHFFQRGHTILNPNKQMELRWMRLRDWDPLTHHPVLVSFLNVWSPLPQKHPFILFIGLISLYHDSDYISSYQIIFCLITVGLASLTFDSKLSPESWVLKFCICRVVVVFCRQSPIRAPLSWPHPQRY